MHAIRRFVRTFPIQFLQKHQFKRRMSHFAQVLNPISGKNEWTTREDDYDYYLEVANAGFGDMLHDTERNRKYYAALKKTISKMHEQGSEVHVLDIGTGTGILSMMAVVAGADSVTACEAFIPMANCAERVFNANGMAEKVKLIKKRSTEIAMGEDMPRKANLLVAELLDTELIGEGAIGIYNHAHDKLLTDDVICIPARATCYAQIAESSLASQWNTMKALANLDGEILLHAPEEVAKCQGEAALHDVQLSQLPMHMFRALAEPSQIFEFDFNRKAAREAERQNTQLVTSTAAGSVDLVFYWWDIKMDLEQEIVLSCAPFWAHPDFKSLASQHTSRKPLPNIIPWRDHWMQAIYYIPKPQRLRHAGDTVTLISSHDEYSLWFNVLATNIDNSRFKAAAGRHSCTCALHMTYSRSRIGQLNQAQRNKRFLQHLEESVDNNTQMLVLGDGCLLGLAAAAMGAAAVICYEPHRYSRNFMESVAVRNNLTNVQFVDKLELLDLSHITHIFAEPYFLNSILPWDNFYFGTLLAKIRHQIPADITYITPSTAKIYAVPVEFLDLHKIRTPLVECEGFNLKIFDEMIEKAARFAHAKVEAQPLWEYPCRALAQPQLVLKVKFHEFSKDVQTKGQIDIECEGNCNGIALWVDWHLDNVSIKSTISTGPAEPIVTGEFIKWDMFVRQGVHLMGNAQDVQPNENHKLQWSVDFKPGDGILNFNFNLENLNI